MIITLNWEGYSWHLVYYFILILLPCFQFKVILIYEGEMEVLEDSCWNKFSKNKSENLVLYLLSRNMGWLNVNMCCQYSILTFRFSSCSKISILFFYGKYLYFIFQKYYFDSLNYPIYLLFIFFSFFK